MADPKERLFRDEAGAALERIRQLEEENRVLRTEIATGQPKSGMFPILLRLGVVALAAGAIGFVFGLSRPYLHPIPECTPSDASR
jgi:hypothetical protein